VTISSSNLLIRVYLDSNDFQGTVWAQLCHPMVGCYTVEGWLVAMTGNPKLTCYETCVLDSVRTAEDLRSVGEVLQLRAQQPGHCADVAAFQHALEQPIEAANAATIVHPLHTA